MPFRDSKLTFFLKDALGGNSKTTLVCTASKQLVHLEESVQTLNFAQRAKKIKNKAAANVMRSPKEMEMMINKLKTEVASLKTQLIELGVNPLMSLSRTKISLDTTADTSKDTTKNSSSTDKSSANADVSLNTLLNDSNLSFDPVKDTQEEAKLTKKASKLLVKETKALQEITMKLTEVETAYEHYREKTDGELIDLREKVESYEENKTSEDELRNQLLAQKFQVAEKEEDLVKLKEGHKAELESVQDEILALQGQLQVKDNFIEELEKQIDEFQQKLEKTGFEVFMQIKQ